MNKPLGPLSRLSQVSPLRTPPQKPALPTPPPAPSDTVELQGGARRLGSKALAALAVSAVVVTTVLATCSGPVIRADQLGAALAMQTPAQDQASALRFEVIPNALGKVDLIRQQDQETDNDASSSRPLSTLGVYLGDGLFLDGGLNLSFVPSRLLQGPVLGPEQLPLQVSDGTQIRQQGNQTLVQRRWDPNQSITRVDNDILHLNFPQRGEWNRSISVVRQGQTTTIQGGFGSPFYHSVRITRSETGVTVTQGSWPLSRLSATIVRQGDQVELRESGIMGVHAQAQVQPDGSLRIHGSGFREIRLQRGENGALATHGTFLPSHSSLNLSSPTLLESGPYGSFTYRSL